MLLGHALTTRSLGHGPMSVAAQTLAKTQVHPVSRSSLQSQLMLLPRAHMSLDTGCRLLRPPHWRLFRQTWDRLGVEARWPPFNLRATTDEGQDIQLRGRTLDCSNALHTSIRIPPFLSFIPFLSHPLCIAAQSTAFPAAVLQQRCSNNGSTEAHVSTSRPPRLLDCVNKQANSPRCYLWTYVHTVPLHLCAGGNVCLWCIQQPLLQGPMPSIALPPIRFSPPDSCFLGYLNSLSTMPLPRD